MFTLTTIKLNNIGHVVIPFTGTRDMRVLIHQLAFRRNHPFARPFLTANLPQAPIDRTTMDYIRADGPVTLKQVARELYVQSLLINNDRKQAYLEATYSVARLIANGSIEVYCDDDDEVTYW